MQEKLKTGYTTGTHATAVFLASLYEYVNEEICENFTVILPQWQVASIEVTKESSYCFSTIKGDNDDIDVTKGCEITCKLTKEYPQNLQAQEPSLLEIGKSKVYIFAGAGVGVVTKKGLKIAPPHPAINPTPLAMMHENAQKILKNTQVTLYATFSVKDGEIIAKDTANAKVGVIRGISILGTRGIVKPVSASAYIDSIKAEIDVAMAETKEYIVFTLGNTAHDYAQKYYNESSIIEIGNFVYDASKELQGHSLEKVIFITSVAKMCKVAQGFKNTHNKYGTIDFDEVRKWFSEELHLKLPEEEFVTLKGVLQTVSKKDEEAFVKLLGYKSAQQLKQWFCELGLDVKGVETITLPNEIKESIQW